MGSSEIREAWLSLRTTRETIETSERLCFFGLHLFGLGGVVALARDHL